MNKVKTFATTAMDKVRNTYEKGRGAMFGLAVAASSMVAPMFCPDVTISDPTAGDATMDAVFGSIISVILSIARYMGIGITAYAVISLLLALKDENADGQSRATRFVIVGIALVAAPTLLKAVLKAMNFNVTW